MNIKQEIRQIIAFRNAVFYLKEYKYFLSIKKNKFLSVTSWLGFRQQANPPVDVTFVASRTR